MKICHVINSLNRGGAETHLLDLCVEQLLNGHEVEIVCIGKDKPNTYSIEEEVLDLNISIKRLFGPRMFNLISYYQLKKIFSKGHFDIVHTHQPRSDLMVFILKRLSKSSVRFKWIVSVHGKYNTYLDKSFVNNLKLIFFKYVYLAWESADQIIVISEEVKDWLLKLNSNLTPVVINYWIRGKTNQKKVSENIITFGFLGRINKNKGIEDLIDALNNFNINFRCLIGGSGPTKYLKYLKTKISESNKKNFNFLGYLDNQEKFFNEVDIFIFPSYSEGLGLVLLEALSYKKICITRNSPPMNQFISTKNGYLFSNLEEFRSQLELACTEFKIDSIYTEKIKNIEVILKEYDVKVLYPMIEKVYIS